MKILIIGASLVGLSVAHCFALQGHSVRVLEQKSTLSPQDSRINVWPNAPGAMPEWLLRPNSEAISDETFAVLLRDLRAGKIAMRRVLVDIARDSDWDMGLWVLIQMLYRRALDTGVEVRFDAIVVKVDESDLRALVWLEDGEVVEGEILLAVDGVRSRIQWTEILSGLMASLETMASETNL